MSNSTILLVQWGRKGAGCKLLLDLGSQLRDLGNDIYISMIDENELRSLIEKTFRDRVSILNIGSKWKLLSPTHFFSAQRKFFKLVEELQPSAVVFVMPHPWDLLLSPDKNCIRIMHDANRHPGDGVWPTTRALRKRMLSGDSLIALSDSVANSLKKYGVSAQVAAHPTFDFKSTYGLQESSDVLVVGRQRKYKGTKVLLEAWPQVLERIPDARLIIAGEGKIDKRLFALKNTHVINRWLSESEIGGLLRSTKCVLFPYIEASQSGLLPAARALGLQVVVTPVGGLLDQASQFGGKVTRDLSATSIALGIQEALLQPQQDQISPLVKEGNLELAKLIATISALKGE